MKNKKTAVVSLNHPDRQKYKTGGDLRLLELVGYSGFKLITPDNNFNEARGAAAKLRILADIIKKLIKHYDHRFIVFEYYTFIPCFLIFKFDVVICLRKDKILYDKSENRIKNSAYVQELIGLLFSRRVIVQSEPDKMRIIGRYPLLRSFLSGKIRVQNNNINTDRLKSVPDDFTVLKPLQIVDGIIDVGFVGTVSSERKNFEFMLKGLEKINRYRFRVHLVGDNAVSESSVGVISYGNISDASELAGIYKKCHFMIVPSLYESFSNIITECLYFRIPFICSDIDTHKAILGERGKDLMFPLEENSFAAFVEDFCSRFDYVSEVESNEQLRAVYSFCWAEAMLERMYD